jgi:hypothetical protein
MDSLCTGIMQQKRLLKSGLFFWCAIQELCTIEDPFKKSLKDPNAVFFRPGGCFFEPVAESTGQEFKRAVLKIALVADDRLSVIPFELDGILKNRPVLS